MNPMFSNVRLRGTRRPFLCVSKHAKWLQVVTRPLHVRIQVNLSTNNSDRTLEAGYLSPNVPCTVFSPYFVCYSTHSQQMALSRILVYTSTHNQIKYQMTNIQCIFVIIAPEVWQEQVRLQPWYSC